MDKKLDDYLYKIERYLKSIPASERVDIVKEIKSEMIELQHQGDISAEQIIERLGEPKELAMAYLGKSISSSNNLNWSRAMSMAAFYGMAGIKGMFVLPIISVLAVGLLFCSVIAPLGGLIKLVGFLLGFDVPFVIMQFGSYSPPPILAFPISVVFGLLLFFAGKSLWNLTIRCVRSMSKKNIIIRQ